MKRNGWKKWALVAAVFVLGATVLTGCKEETDKSYEQAMEYTLKGRYEEAIELFKRAISQGETDPVIYGDMGIAYLRMGDTENALKQMEYALTLDPNHKGVLKRTGIFYMETGDTDVALSYFLKALPADKNYTDADRETLGYIGEIRMMREEWQQAVDCYNPLIEGNYHVAEHEIAAGECYVKMNQIKAATQYFDMVKDEKDISPRHFIYIYKCLMEADQIDLAAEYFEYGKTLCGAPPMKEMTEGEYYVRAGLINVAREKLETEDSVGARLATAWLHLQDGDFTAAEAIYRQLLTEKVDMPEVATEYMAVCVLRNEYDNAKILISKIYEYKDPGVMETALWNEIMMYERMGDFTTALEKLEAYKKGYGEDEAVSREVRFLERILSK